MTTTPDTTLQALRLAPLPDTPEGAALNTGVTDVDALTAELSVCVGRMRMSLADLLAAKANQILTLDQLIDAPVDILVGKQVIARGQLMAVEDHFAVRITEPPRPGARG